MTRYRNNNKRRAKAPAKAIQKNKEKVRPPFRIIPLGGMKEIGKNCTLIECNNEILIIDCGFAFPEYEMFGIDVVIPDFTYLKENIEKVKGLIITHGHEDHIGGIPYLLQEMSVPVYASPLAMGMIEHKLEENYLSCEGHVIRSGDRFSIGCFSVEAIQTNHSIADSLAYSIKFPGGHVVHTGDFKIDYSPLDGKVIDLNRFSQLGDQGVDVLLCDSTNVLRKGYTPSEAVVRRSIDEIFDNTDRRIIIATFASNVHRIKYFIEASMKHHRRIAVSGRSMENLLSLSKSLGYLDDIPDSVFVDVSEARNIADNKITIITTGSQGEPMSALSRMASNDHKAVQIREGDTVILSSNPIPGNEKTVANVVNKLFERGAKVIYSDIADIHVSGHACQEELKLMHSLIKPKYFVPVHGEYRHLKQHGLIAESLGLPQDHIFIISNGDILSYKKNHVEISEGVVPAEAVLVDGLGVGDVGNIVLRDRKMLSESGLIVVVAAIDSSTGMVVSGPDIISRGFIYVRENEELVEHARKVAELALEECMTGKVTDWNAMKQSVREALRRFIFTRTGRSPIILPIFLDV